MAGEHKALQYKTLQYEALQHTSAGKDLKLPYPANRQSSGGPKVLCCLLAAAVTAAGIPGFSVLAADNGWEEEDGRRYWYEDGVKQGTEGRGKEIYDPDSDAWYWLDAIQGGALTTNKDVYQESLAGDWGDTVNAQGQRIGKWVRYDENGHMVKGWSTNDNGTYYFDLTFGTMAKGTVTIDGKQYTFDENSGILQSSPAPVTDGWATVDGVSYWYENGVKQGTEGRGKEIYDPASDAWYWLDAVQGGALTRNKDVYQESLAGDWGDNVNAQGERIGKWVRYDGNGHMIKGWNTNDNGTYYFDTTYGTMAKGTVQIEDKSYIFDSATGVLQEEGGTVKYSGEWKGLDWKITDSGKLMVSGNLTERVDWLEAPWKAYDGETRTAYMDFTGATYLNNLFSLGKKEDGYHPKESCIEEIDLHNLDTSQVKSMSDMFSGCMRLTSLNLTNFDTSQVRYMDSMFFFCKSLTSLNLSHFDTSQVSRMSYMFWQCGSLSSLDISNFDTSSVTSMYGMFWFCSKLTSLDVSNFDTRQVTNMGSMFWGCSSLTSLDVSNFDTKKVTDMGSMFQSCESLTSLDVSNFDTKQVTDMGGMFQSCDGLTSLDLSNFDTSQVKDMSLMFWGSDGLTSLDLSSFDTSRVTSMYCMFFGCRGLTSLDVSNFNTSQVTNMSGMFGNCSFTSLDLSSFNTSQVTSMVNMFAYSKELANIYVGSGWKEADENTDMFKDCGTDHVTLKQ